MNLHTTHLTALSHTFLNSTRLACTCAALLCFTYGQANAGTINTATGGTANASSEGFGSIDDDANDGNRNGNFGAGSVWHSTDGAANHFWEVDLGSNQTLDHVLAFPRTGLGPHWNNFKIEVRDASNALVFNQSFLPGDALDRPWGTNAVRGVVGQTVRIESNGTPVNTSMSEFEVYTRTAAPFGKNLLENTTLAASAPGFGTSIGDGADGDIDGNYSNAGSPIYHSASSGVGQFWRADFGGNLAEVYHVNVFGRTDTTTTGIARLSILDEDLAEVYGVNIDLSSNSLNALTYRFEELIPSGTLGHYVQLQTVNNNFLAFAEVEVFGRFAAPEPSTMLLAAMGFTGLGLCRRRRQRVR